MSTAEILSKLTPKTSNYTGVTGVRGSSDLGWQDILQAMQGIDPWKVSFMLFVYAGDPKSRHSFFAGLFMEIMQRPEVQLWIQQRREQPGYHRSLETLCLISIQELGCNSGRPLTEKARAALMGVSLSTWKRKYKTIYRTILTTPAEWETEVMQIVTQRLR